MIAMRTKSLIRNGNVPLNDSLRGTSSDRAFIT